MTKARAELSGFIEAAAQYGEALIVDLANGLDAIVLSELDAEGNLKAAKAELFEATGKLWRDPLGVFTNVYGAATQFQASVAKASLNLATMAIPKRAREAVLRETAALRRLSPELGRQIRRLADENIEQSIGWIIAGLARAVLARRPGRGHGANVKSGTTSISKASHPGQPLEPRPVERRAQGD
ncbi:hypothetical protein, partial [Burkholderia diffusa]|uniref:hypothetical protein n=1 Tax=Burkholderia diffusa TaxID=488732 RepID=UPI00193A7E86